MPKITFKIFYLAVLIPSFCLGTPQPLIFQKSLGYSGKINIYGSIAKNFSDIRFDSNGDGQIDFWKISKKNLSINIAFKKRKIVNLTLSSKSKGKVFELIYKTKKPNVLGLARAYFRNPKNYFNENPVMDQTCSPRELSSFLPIKKINKILKNQSDKLICDAVVKYNCEEPLTSESEKSLDQAIVDLFDLKPSSKTSDNKFLNCLYKSPDFEQYMPAYVDFVLSAPINGPKIEIPCQNNSDKCGSSLYKETSSMVEVSPPSNSCKMEPQQYWTENIFHDSIHGCCGLSEAHTKDIVERCVYSKKIDAKPEEPVLDEAMTIEFIPNPTEFQVVSEQAASTLPATNVPKEIALGTGGLDIKADNLNSGFQSVAAANSRPLVIPTSDAEPVVSLAERMIREAIPAAQATTLSKSYIPKSSGPIMVSSASTVKSRTVASVDSDSPAAVTDTPRNGAASGKAGVSAGKEPTFKGPVKEVSSGKSVGSSGASRGSVSFGTASLDSRAPIAPESSSAVGRLASTSGGANLDPATRAKFRSEIEKLRSMTPDMYDNYVKDEDNAKALGELGIRALPKNGKPVKIEFKKPVVVTCRTDNKVVLCQD